MNLEKLYSAPYGGREVSPLGVVTHGQKHKPRACQRQRYKLRTCQTMINTLQVDGLARISGLTPALHKAHPQPPNSVPQCLVWRIGFGRGEGSNHERFGGKRRRIARQQSNTKKSNQQLTASQLITGILIQTRHVQHMSCSSGQVLHLWRAHNPLNTSLIRELIQKLGTRSHSTPRVDRTTMSWITRALPG